MLHAEGKIDARDYRRLSSGSCELKQDAFLVADNVNRGLFRVCAHVSEKSHPNYPPAKQNKINSCAETLAYGRCKAVQESKISDKPTNSAATEVRLQGACDSESRFSCSGLRFKIKTNHGTNLAPKCISHIGNLNFPISGISEFRRASQH